jgi:copper chaperone CopZ
MKQYEIKISGMTCNGCAKSIEKALGRNEAIRTATVDFPSATAKVEGEVDEETLRQTLDRLGFAATSITARG